MTKNERNCKRKQVYRTEKLATTHARYARLKYAKDLRVYRCSACGLWHLTTDQTKHAIKAALLGDA